jgi:hypothetical protein
MMHILTYTEGCGTFFNSVYFSYFYDFEASRDEGRNILFSEEQK